MDMTTTEAEPQFSQPVRQIALMLMALALVAFGGYLIYPTIQPVVMANPFLNGVIGAVFVVGVIACFWQVFQLISSVNWIEDFALDGPDNSGGRAPRLLAPLAALMRTRGANGQIGATSSRSILESVATRVEELRDITRYIVNLLIFLGLLGTFYGLATTVPAVVDTIRSLVPADGDGTLDVSRLLVGLESQMDGMGTAFGSSLLGLAGSLVVGLLELFTSHGQNRFYRELEEWLSGITRVSFAGTDGEGEGMGGPVAGVLDHMAEQMDEMRKMFTKSDANRVGLEEKMGNVAESVYLLASNMDGGEDGAMARVADGQDKLVKLLQVQAESGGADAETRMRMRSIDTQLLHILEEMAAGRQESIGDIRADLAALIKATRTGGRAEPRTSDITDGADDQWR